MYTVEVRRNGETHSENLETAEDVLLLIKSMKDELNHGDVDVQICEL